MPLPWIIIGGLAAFFTPAIMTLFSSCCGDSDSEDDHRPVNPHSPPIPAPREAPEFLAVRYKDTVAGVRPTTHGDAASSRSSQLSPRTTPSSRGRDVQGLEEAPHTPTNTAGRLQSVSSSIYSQLSHTSTPPRADILCDAEQGYIGSQAVGAANTVPDTARASQHTAPDIACDETVGEAEQRKLKAKE